MKKRGSDVPGRRGESQGALLSLDGGIGDPLSPVVLRAHGLGSGLVIPGVGGLLSWHLPRGLLCSLLPSPVTGAHTSSPGLTSPLWQCTPAHPSKTPSSSAVVVIVIVQPLSCVQLFVTPWTIAHQASLSITISWSLLRLVSIEWVIPSNPSLIPFSSCPQSFPASRCFPMSWLFPSDG